VSVLFSLLKEGEHKNTQRVIWMKCSVQSYVFQGNEVSDILYCFLLCKTRLKKEEHGDAMFSQRRGDC